MDKLGCPGKIKKTKGDVLGLLDYPVGPLDGPVRIVIVEHVQDLPMPVFGRGVGGLELV